jgi:hypothetical protein
MMENQHRQITGYRELDEDEIALMNKIKGIGLVVEAIIEELRATEGIDQRWVAIGVTQLQQGLMALTRGVAQPSSF